MISTRRNGYDIRQEDHVLEMVFTIKKARAGANPEYPPRTHPRTNIREVRTPSRKVFTREHNELFIQRVFQYSPEAKGDEFHYLVPGLKESSTEDYMKQAHRSLACQCHPGKNQHSQVSDVTQMIN